VICVVGIGLGVIIGHFSRSSSSCSSAAETTAETTPCDGVYLGPEVPRKIIEDAAEGITEKIIAMMSATNIQNNLR
jgi:hypothetical protein